MMRDIEELGERGDFDEWIPCDECGNDIFHDEYVFPIWKAVNAHGQPINVDEDTKLVCEDCAPDCVTPEPVEYRL